MQGKIILNVYNKSLEIFSIVYERKIKINKLINEMVKCL